MSTSDPALEADPRSRPRAEYERRAAAHRSQAEAAARRVAQTSTLRLLVFLLLSAIGIGLFTWDLSPHLLWLPLATFIALIVRQARASGQRVRALRALRLYEDGLARLRGEPASEVVSGSEFLEASHPYAGDLDLFGERSLFALVCVARTHVGQRRLASWLLEPATPEAVRDRQAAVGDLRERLDLREELAIVESDTSGALERNAVLQWAQAPRTLHSKVLPWLHGLAALASTTMLVLWLDDVVPAGWMILVWFAQYLLATIDRRRVEVILEEADRPAQDLALIGRIIDPLAEAHFEAPRLRALHTRLESGGIPPGVRIQRLRRLMDFVEARLNQIFLPISWLGSLGTQLAYRIEAWREENGPFLEGWLDAVAEFEATASLAGYAYENPADPFPVLEEDNQAGGPVLQGAQLGHPLLSATVCVRNDIHLAADAATAPQAYVISGSNMSGKSTYLRTVGVNVVLALAGAPVRATSLRLSPLAIGASIQLHDSLQEGASRFYAEIERLRQVVDLSEGSTPALFLLDEILHGTNSHDRRIGAAAVVRTLVENGAIGLVTTHDLALAAIEGDTGARLRNVHFEDQMEDGKMAFDYTLKPGVVTRSNALPLMRAVGLKVADPDTDTPEDEARC